MIDASTVDRAGKTPTNGAPTVEQPTTFGQTCLLIRSGSIASKHVDGIEASEKNKEEEQLQDSHRKK